MKTMRLALANALIANLPSEVRIGLEEDRKRDVSAAVERVMAADTLRRAQAPDPSAVATAMSMAYLAGAGFGSHRSGRSGSYSTAKHADWSKRKAKQKMQKASRKANRR